MGASGDRVRADGRAGACVAVGDGLRQEVVVVVQGGGDADLPVAHMREWVLAIKAILEHWQERGIDLTNLLRAPDVPAGTLTASPSTVTPTVGSP